MAKFSGFNEVPQTCYTMAYFVLPRYVYGQPDAVIDKLSRGRTGALFFYFMACVSEGKEPNEQTAESFSVHSGRLDDRHDYFLIQYPAPPEVDLSDVDDDRIFEHLGKIVLAPYFSVMIRDRTDASIRYFILGQSPDGGTTFRSVMPNINANLGRGCEPQLDAFLELLRERVGQLSSREPESS